MSFLFSRFLSNLKLFQKRRKKIFFVVKWLAFTQQQISASHSSSRHWITCLPCHNSQTVTKLFDGWTYNSGPIFFIFFFCEMSTHTLYVYYKPSWRNNNKLISCILYSILLCVVFMKSMTIYVWNYYCFFRNKGKLKTINLITLFFLLNWKPL